MNRLHTLDYLRGLAASSIMCYHFMSWSYGKMTACDIWGRIGIYGVSIFYVLSGLTLYIVYQKRFTVVDFTIKRIFRIFPLLWLVTVGTIALGGFNGDYKMLVLNFTGLFGFFDWSRYYAIGAWSIGNELVFYALFPFLFYLLKKDKPLYLLGIGTLLFIVFSFFVLSPVNELEDQWRLYVNPLNQAPYFIIGMLIGYGFNETKVKSWLTPATISCAVLLFIFYPSGLNRAELVTGIDRIVFTLLITAICFAFFKLGGKLPYLHKPLSFLGETSYSIYLLHPFAWMVSGKLASGWAKMGIAVAITLFVAYFVYRFYEQYFIKLGRKVTGKIAPKFEPVISKLV